jgi:undecaprenyl diphosphate synthase
MNILLLQDGSRRWAKERGKGFDEGYKVTVQKLAECFEWLHAHDFTEVWVPICGLNNLKRPAEQVTSFLSRFLEVQQYTKLPLSFTITGNLDALPSDFAKRYKALPSSKDKSFTVHYALAWSTDQEFLDIIQHFRDHPKEPITHEAALQQSAVSAPIDLIIRAGKVQRLSAMVPWHSPYAELYFVDKFFPDFTPDDLQAAISFYHTQEHRHGL